MIALEVSINGKNVKLAGRNDLCVLNAHVTATGRLGDKTYEKEIKGTDYIIYCHLGGLTSKANGADEHVSWIESQMLSVGDEIRIKILETQIADDPELSTAAGENK